MRSIREQVRDARKQHAKSCRYMPHLWPAWHIWKQAEENLKVARKARDVAKKAWKEFSRP